MPDRIKLSRFIYSIHQPTTSLSSNHTTTWMSASKDMLETHTYNLISVIKMISIPVCSKVLLLISPTLNSYKSIHNTWNISRKKPMPKIRNKLKILRSNIQMCLRYLCICWIGRLAGKLSIVKNVWSWFISIVSGSVERD